jgi:hypothetical protein
MLFEWEKCCGNESNMLPQIMQSGLPLIGRQKQTTKKQQFESGRAAASRQRRAAPTQSNIMQHI